MIRSAEPSDYEGITAIRDALVLDVAGLNRPEYVAKLEENGFLVPVGLARSDFEDHASDYIVSEIDGEVAGFLRLDDEQEMEAHEEPRWKNPELEEIYWSAPHVSIGKIAVAPAMKKRGIAGTMLAEAEQRAKAKGVKFLFSFIVTCDPPTNYPSISFHTRNGFQVAAPLEPQVAYGIPDYVATLYGKRL